MDQADRTRQQQNKWGQNRSQEQALHLTISNTPPEKKGGVWESLATATLGRGNKAVLGREVKFFVGGAEVGSETTDGDGNASILLALSPGKNLVRAQVVRGTTYRTILVTVGVENPEEYKLLKPRVRVYRDKKEHVFRVLVSDDQGKGRSCRVQVTSSEEPSCVINIDAQDGGTHRITLARGERFRFLEFSILGTNLSTVSAAYAA